jgi:hypothetical protein
MTMPDFYRDHERDQHKRQGMITFNPFASTPYCREVPSALVILAGWERDAALITPIFNRDYRGLSKIKQFDRQLGG